MWLLPLFRVPHFMGWYGRSRERGGEYISGDFLSLRGIDQTSQCRSDWIWTDKRLQQVDSTYKPLSLPSLSIVSSPLSLSIVPSYI